jgi:hypothetical protein
LTVERATSRPTPGGKECKTHGLGSWDVRRRPASEAHSEYILTPGMAAQVYREHSGQRNTRHMVSVFKNPEDIFTNYFRENKSIKMIFGGSEIKSSFKFSFHVSASFPVLAGHSTEPTLLLCNHGRSGAGFVFPVRSQDALLLVITSEPVDARLDEDQTELGVTVLPVFKDETETVKIEICLKLSASNERIDGQSMKKSTDLFLSRCFLIATAFLMRWYKSSGIAGARPLDLRIRRILLPVTKRTWATPWESLKMTPESAEHEDA